MNCAHSATCRLLRLFEVRSVIIGLDLRAEVLGATFKSGRGHIAFISCLLHCTQMEQRLHQDYDDVRVDLLVVIVEEEK